MLNYIESYKSAKIVNNSIILEPKIGSVLLSVFDESVNSFDLFFKNISGNGKFILSTNNTEINLTVSSKTVPLIYTVSNNNVLVSRTKDSVGEIAIINLVPKVIEVVKKWKWLIKNCGEYQGIRLVNGELVFSQNSWIDSSNINSIKTEPENISQNINNKIIFLTSGKIIDIDVKQIIYTNKIVQNLISPFPKLENIECITKKRMIKTFEPTIVYDSDIINFNYSNNNDKLAKIHQSNGKKYLILKRFGNFYQSISGLKQNTEYLVSIFLKKINGNGKIYLSLSGGQENIGFADSSESAKIFKIFSGNDLGKLTIRMSEESVGEILISRILIEEFNSNTSYKLQPELINTRLQSKFDITKPVIPECILPEQKQNNKNIKFVVVVPSFNNEKFCLQNINSILNQNYSNYRVIFIDDCSTDKTFEKVSQVVNNCEKQNLFTVIKNSKRIGALENIYNAVLSCSDNEVVVTLDGDDWFSDNSVLAKLNNVYSSGNIWMTYGQYKTQNGKIGHSKGYTHKTIESNQFRQTGWSASHLRTFYSWLFKKIKKEDLQFEGKFYEMAWDLAMMLPMLEMSGFHSKFIPDILYIYNTENPLNDHKVNLNLQQKLSHQILSSPKYEKLSFITFKELGQYGRLGNQMFQIAASLSASIKNGSGFGGEWYCGYTKKNMSQFFKNAHMINCDSIIPDFTYKEPYFHYSPIPQNKNMNLYGYFQSEKYFENYKDIIRSYFEPADFILNKLKNKYGNILENSCSLHVRRGDFVNNKTHQVCDLNYYNRAIELIKSKTQINNFLVFSDDIFWCKTNFPSEFHFIDGNLDVEDLILMSLTSHQAISNSSFSWWAAWLNKNPNKIIVAPNRWFANSSLNDKDIYTKEMIKI